MTTTRRSFIRSTAALATTAMADAGASWRPRSASRQPDIIMVVLDDVGFGDLGCYGSEIPTPCIDNLASRGVRYNNFHVTSLCAPTRACLLTGVNAHRAGVGNIPEWGRNHPGYRGWIRGDIATVAEMLAAVGYRNYAVGKWHLSPLTSRNAEGPFDQWPTGRGFDDWYGFHGAAVDHWHPELFHGTAASYPDKSKGYHLTEDLIDRSTDFIRAHDERDPDRPYFMHLALGACHFPYHVPADYMARQRGRYASGWDAVRSERLARQMALGIVPDDTTLSPRNPDVPAWAAVPEAERRFSARTQEAFAGFLEHTDDQLQRLVDFLASTDRLDDTVILVVSDNGAGAWAPPAGRLDVHRVVYIEPESIEELTAAIDDVGTDASQPSYAPGWAQVSNTPLKFYKGDTYEGGIRAPLVVHWPNGDLAEGAICRQYHHAIDIVPTLFEMIGEGPRMVDGISMAYTLDAPEAPTKKRLQHYETAGDRAIWADGWKAVTQHKADSEFDDDHWALYDATTDFTELDDLSSTYPDRVADLKALWFEEAKVNRVLPLEDDLLALEGRTGPRPRPEYEFLPGAMRLDRRSAPDILAFDFEFRAYVVLDDASASGVLLASGDSMAGYEWLMRDGRPEFHYLYTRNEHYSISSDRRIPNGRHVLRVRGRKTGDKSARLELMADETRLAVLDLPKMWDVKALNAGVRCGVNRGAPISRSYEGEFGFDQVLERVIVALDI